MESKNNDKNLAMIILEDGINSRLKPLLLNENLCISHMEFYKSILKYTNIMYEFINISNQLKISDIERFHIATKICSDLNLSYELFLNSVSNEKSSKSLFITKFETLKTLIFIYLYNNTKSESENETEQNLVKTLNKSLERLKIYYDCSDQDLLILDNNNDISNNLDEEFKFEFNKLSLSSNLKEIFIDSTKFNYDSFSLFLKFVSCLFFVDEKNYGILKNSLNNIEYTNFDLISFLELKFSKKKEEVNFLKKTNQICSRSRRTSFESAYYENKQNQKIDNYFKANNKNSKENIENISEYANISKEKIYSGNINFNFQRLQKSNENFCIRSNKCSLKNSTTSLSENIKSLKLTRQTKLDEKNFSFKKTYEESCASSINYGNYQKYSSNSINFNSNLSNPENQIICLLENDKFLRKDSSLKLTDSFNTNSVLSINHNNTIHSFTSYNNLAINNNSNMNTNSSNNLCMNSKISNFSFENYLNLKKNNSTGSNIGNKNFTNYLSCKRSNESLKDTCKEKSKVDISFSNVYNSRSNFNSMLANNSKKNFIRNSKLKSKKSKSTEIQSLLKNETTPQNIQHNNSTDKSTEFGSFESKNLIQYSSKLFYGKNSYAKRKNTMDSLNLDNKKDNENENDICENSHSKIEKERNDVIVSQFNIDEDEDCNDEVLVMQTPTSKKNNPIINNNQNDNYAKTKKNLLAIFDQVNN